MVFRNIEVDFDIYDADTAEVYEGAVQTVLESAVPKEGESLADGIRRQCNTVFAFFDTLFGDGFHKELFGQRTNMMECLQAFKEFLELVSKQREQLTALTAEIQSAQTAAPATRVACIAARHLS